MLWQKKKQKNQTTNSLKDLLKNITHYLKNPVSCGIFYWLFVKSWGKIIIAYQAALHILRRRLSYAAKIIFVFKPVVRLRTSCENICFQPIVPSWITNENQGSFNNESATGEHSTSCLSVHLIWTSCPNLAVYLDFQSYSMTPLYGMKSRYFQSCSLVEKVITIFFRGI